MRDLLAALGLVLVIEGLSLAAFPAAWRRAMKAALKAPEQPMRIAGLLVGVAGVIVVWLVRL